MMAVVVMGHLLAEGALGQHLLRLWVNQLASDK